MENLDTDCSGLLLTAAHESRTMPKYKLSSSRLSFHLMIRMHVLSSLSTMLLSSNSSALFFSCEVYGRHVSRQVTGYSFSSRQNMVGYTRAEHVSSVISWCFGTLVYDVVDERSLSFSSPGKPLVKTSRMTVLNTEKPTVTVDIGGTVRTVRGVNVTINCQVAGEKLVHVFICFRY
jgi:hypothetical protein